MQVLDAAAEWAGRKAATRAAWWGALAAICATLAWPLALVDVPPLLDYPNHLARAYLLAFGPDDPVLAGIAETHWALIPNLAIDAILPAMLRLWPGPAGAHLAGRILLGAVMLLPVLGCTALAGAALGRRSWWALGSGLVACNQLFLLGFLNFQLSAGLALGFAALWLHWRDRRPRLALAGGLLAGPVLFACHLMGLLFYLLLVAAAECPRLPPGRAALRRMAARLLPLLPVPLALYLLSPLGHEAAGIGWWTLDYKLVHLATGFLNYDALLDAATFILFAGFLLGCLRAGRLAVPHAGLALAATAALYLASPFNFKGTSFLDVRFAAMFAFAAFALPAPRLTPRAALLAAAGVVALLGARTATLAQVWHGHAAELAQLRAAIAPVMPGDRVLLATVDAADAPGYWSGPAGQTTSDGTRVDWHVAALLTIERRAFWPFLFADPTQQPIRLREPYASLAARTRSIPDARQLNGRALTAADLRTVPLAAHWECCYDKVLLLHAGALPGFSDPRLERLAGNDYAALYRVRPAGRALASAPVDRDAGPLSE